MNTCRIRQFIGVDECRNSSAITLANFDKEIKILEEIGAAEILHINGTLLDHLVRTAIIVQRWGGDSDQIRCALFHSVYGTRHAKLEIFPLEDRSVLQSIIGSRAEFLVYLFATHRFEEGFSLTRWRGTEQSAEDQDLESLLAVDLANTIDQSCAESGVPELWIAQVQETVRRTKRLLPIIPKLLWEAKKVSREDENSARFLYEQSLSLLAHAGPSAESMLEKCIAQLKILGEPYLLLAGLQQLRGCRNEAFLNATRGVSLLRQLGAVWDKRATFEEWLEFGEKTIAVSLADIK